MATVNLKFRNTDLVLDCDNMERIETLSMRYNNRLSGLAAKFHNASDLKLALIAGLMIEDQLDSLLKKVESEADSKKDENIEIKKTFNETISQIADYVDHLASRVEKS